MSQSVFPVFASRATIEALFARRRSESTGGRSETRNGCGRRPDGAAHVKSWSMCAESPFGRALRGSRKSLSGLRLHHGLRDGCAAPETEAVAVVPPFFDARCGICGGWDVHSIPSRCGGSLRVQQSFAGRPEDAPGGGNPTLGKPDRRLEPAVSMDGGETWTGAVA